MPPKRIEDVPMDGDLEDDTPVLHRTHDSVWKSYAARNLRSMSDGSYLDAGIIAGIISLPLGI